MLTESQKDGERPPGPSAQLALIGSCLDAVSLCMKTMQTIQLIHSLRSEAWRALFPFSTFRKF